MGFNTAFILCNDTLHDLESRPADLGRAIVKAATQACMKDKPFRLKGFIGVHLIQQEHADSLGVVAFGGNTMIHLGFVSSRVEPNDNVGILRQLASRMGYTLHKKPK